MQTKPSIKTFPTKVKVKIPALANLRLEKLDCGIYPATYLDLPVSAIILDAINYQALISEFPYVLPFYDAIELKSRKVALIVPRITGSLETHPPCTKRQAIAAAAGICKAFAYLLAQGVLTVQDIEPKDLVMTDGVAINSFHLPEGDSANKTIRLTNLIGILLEIFYKNPAIRPQQSAEKDSCDEAIKNTLFLLNSREQFEQVDEAIIHLLQVAKNFDIVGEAFSIRRMTTYTPEQQKIIEQVNRMNKEENAAYNSLYDFYKNEYNFYSFFSIAYSNSSKEHLIKAKELKQTSSPEVRIQKLKENLSNIKKNRLSQIHPNYLIKFPKSNCQGDTIQTDGEYFGTPVTLLQLTVNLQEDNSSRVFQTLQSAPRHPNLGKVYGYIQDKNFKFTFIINRYSKGSLFEIIHRARDNFPWHIRLRLFNELISLIHFTHSMGSHFKNLETNLLELNDSYRPFLSLLRFINKNSTTTANVLTSSTGNHAALRLAHKAAELQLRAFGSNDQNHRSADIYHLAILFWSLWQRADILYALKLTDITIRNPCKTYEAEDIVLNLTGAGLGPRFFDLTKIRATIRNLESFPNTWGKLLKEIPQLDNFFRAYLERMNEGHLAPSLIKPVDKYTLSLVSELKNSDLKYARSGVIYFSPSHCYFRIGGKLHKRKLPKTLGITAKNLTQKLKDRSFRSDLKYAVPPLQAFLSLEEIGDRLLLNEVKNIPLPKDKQSLLREIDECEKNWLNRSRKDMQETNPLYPQDKLTALLPDLNLPEGYAEVLELCVKDRLHRIEVAKLHRKIIKNAYPKFKAKTIYQMIQEKSGLNLNLTKLLQEIQNATPHSNSQQSIPSHWSELITIFPTLENLSQLFLIWELLKIMPSEYADFWQSLEYWKNLNKLPLTWTELQDTFALVESSLKKNIKPAGWDEFYGALSQYKDSDPIEFSAMQTQLYKLRLKYELTDTDLFKTKIPVEFFEHPSLLLKKILNDLEKVKSNTYMPSSEWIKKFSHAPLLSQILNIWGILDILPPAWQSLHSVFQAMKNSEMQLEDINFLKKILSDPILLTPTNDVLPLEWQGKELAQLKTAMNFSPFKVPLQTNKIPLAIPVVFANSLSQSTPEPKIADPESAYFPEFH